MYANIESMGETEPKYFTASNNEKNALSSDKTQIKRVTSTDQIEY